MTKSELKAMRVTLRRMRDDAKALVTKFQLIRERCPDTLLIGDYSLDMRSEDVETELETYVKDIEIELERANGHTSVDVIKTNRKFGKDSRQGVHLLNPEESELERAIEDAQAKGFETIYIHKSRKEKQ